MQNPFRLKPVAPPAPPVASVTGATSPLSGLLRQAERRYWQARAAVVAQQERVPAWLFLRLIRQESGFNPRARSPVGAIGLTQLMPETAQQLGVNPYDPEQNLRGGARYLRQMLQRFRGHIPSALASYNAGPVAVEAYQRGEARRVGNKIINAGRRVLPIPPYRETRNYVASILSGLPAVPTTWPMPQSGPGPTLPVEAPPSPPTLRRTGRIYIADAGGESATGLSARSGSSSVSSSAAVSETRENDQPADAPRPPRSVFINATLNVNTSASSVDGSGSQAVPPVELENSAPKPSGMVRNLPNRSIYIVQSGGRP